MMKTIKRIAFGLMACFAMLAATGCAQIGVTPAQGFEQQLAYGYATVTAVRSVTADALPSKIISAADATKVLTMTDTARSSLDFARLSQFSGRETTALEKLAEATYTLLQVQAFLRDKGVMK